MDAFKNLVQVTLIGIERLEENKGQLPGVPENPRRIEDDKFALLKQDIIDYPEFLKYNPLKVFQLENGNYIILGGNMRFRALSEIGVKAIPCVVFDADTPTDKLKAYAMLDNNGFGEYDWGKLKSGGWGDDEQLTAWGLIYPMTGTYRQTAAMRATMAIMTAIRGKSLHRLMNRAARCRPLERCMTRQSAML